MNNDIRVCGLLDYKRIFRVFTIPLTTKIAVKLTIDAELEAWQV